MGNNSSSTKDSNRNNVEGQGSRRRRAKKTQTGCGCFDVFQDKKPKHNKRTAGAEEVGSPSVNSTGGKTQNGDAAVILNRQNSADEDSKTNADVTEENSRKVPDEDVNVSNMKRNRNPIVIEGERSHSGGSSRPFQKNDRVVWIEGQGRPRPHLAKFKWMGWLDGIHCVGLEMKDKGNISFRGHTGSGIFRCKHGHRAVVPLNEVFLYEDYVSDQEREERFFPETVEPPNSPTGSGVFVIEGPSKIETKPSRIRSGSNKQKNWKEGDVIIFKDTAEQAKIIKIRLSEDGILSVVLKYIADTVKFGQLEEKPLKNIMLVADVIPPTNASCEGEPTETIASNIKLGSLKATEALPERVKVATPQKSAIITKSVVPRDEFTFSDCEEPPVDIPTLPPQTHSAQHNINNMYITAQLADNNKIVPKDTSPTIQKIPRIPSANRHFSQVSLPQSRYDQVEKKQHEYQDRDYLSVNKRNSNLPVPMDTTEAGVGRKDIVDDGVNGVDILSYSSLGFSREEELVYSNEWSPTLRKSQRQAAGKGVEAIFKKQMKAARGSAADREITAFGFQKSDLTSTDEHSESDYYTNDLKSETGLVRRLSQCDSLGSPSLVRAAQARLSKSGDSLTENVKHLNENPKAALLSPDPVGAEQLSVADDIQTEFDSVTANPLLKVVRRPSKRSTQAQKPTQYSTNDSGSAPTPNGSTSKSSEEVSDIKELTSSATIPSDPGTGIDFSNSSPKMAHKASAGTGYQQPTSAKGYGHNRSAYFDTRSGKSSSTHSYLASALEPAKPLKRPKLTRQENHESVLSDEEMERFGIYTPPNGIYVHFTENDVYLRTCLGQGKGIHGQANSCYLDATIFSLFYCTDIFDDLLLVRKSEDKDLAKQVKSSLKVVVNTLRDTGSCSGSKVMKFREAMQPVCAKIKGSFMDAEELIFNLFDDALKLPEFIHYSTDVSDYLAQILIDTRDKKKCRTVQELLEKSFQIQENMKLKSTPSPAFFIQMPRSDGKLVQYDAIIPNMFLQLGPLLQEGSTSADRKCVCDDKAFWECQKCIESNGTEPTLAFCDNCKNSLLDEIHSSLDHSSTPVLIKYDAGSVELLAVICVRSNHYVTFAKCGAGSKAPWLFFDSMVGSSSEVVVVPEMNKWLQVLEKTPDDFRKGGIPSLVRRMISDCHICIYYPS